MDVTADLNSGPRIRLQVSMYRRSVDSGYQKMIEKKIQDGAFTDYITMMLNNVVSAGNDKLTYAVHSRYKNGILRKG